MSDPTVDPTGLEADVGVTDHVHVTDDLPSEVANEVAAEVAASIVKDDSVKDVAAEAAAAAAAATVAEDNGKKVLWYLRHLCKYSMF